MNSTLPKLPQGWPSKVEAIMINKKYLTLIAGIVWMFAGSMVMRFGLPLLVKLTPTLPWLIPAAAVIFFLFYWSIFKRLVYKHTNRIAKLDKESLPFWRFFDLPSYIIMSVMMSGGYLLRSKHLIPPWMIAFFYTGLGLALFSCGVRFVSVYLRTRKNSNAAGSAELTVVSLAKPDHEASNHD